MSLTDQAGHRFQVFITNQPDWEIWSSWSRIRRWLLRRTIVGGAKR
jgi:hypothetical protein